MNTPALVYYYFGNPEVTTTVSKHFEVPIILAIANVRRFHPAMPIYVVDASEVEMDWEDYPEFLHFKVFRRKSPVCEAMKKAPLCDGIHTYVKLLAKPVAVKEVLPDINQAIIMVSDADLFWTKPLFPLLGSFDTKFCCGSNTGLWYFHRHLANSSRALDLWTSFCTQVCFDHELCRKVVRTAIGAGHMHEEVVMQYLLINYREYFESPPLTENAAFARYTEMVHNQRAFKTVHVHGNNLAMAKLKKALACLWIKELRERVTQVLGTDRMAAIFDDLEVPCYSLYDITRMSRMNRETDFEALAKKPG